MISVVVTTHRGRLNLLKRAIASVFAQTFTDWELIVVDDVSKDGTKTYIRGLKDPRVRYIEMPKKTKSHAESLNVGTREAKGEFIAYLDSDNEYRPDHLNALNVALNASKDIDLVYGDRMIRDESTGKDVQIGYFSEFDPYLILQRNYIDASDFLARKQIIFDIGGWDEKSVRMNDWNLLVRLVKAGYRFKRVPLIITNYSMNDNCLSTSGAKVNWSPFEVEIDMPYLKEVKEPKVAIISLTYDRLDYSKICFKTLKDTAGYPYDHFVVDQGSTDGTQEWLKEQNFHKLFLNKENVGISGGYNMALDAIGDDYQIIGTVDNDAYFENKGWLKAMVGIWKKNRMLAMSCYINGLINNPGGAPRDNYGSINGELIGITSHLGGICHFVDSKVFKNWRWDETLPKHGWQDIAFSKYLQEQDYGMGYLENWHCTHHETTKGQETRYKEYFERRKIDKTTSWK